MTSDSAARRQVERERWHLLHQLVRVFEPAIAVLGVVWLVLLVIDLTRGLSPVLRWISNGIWIVFVLDFAAEFLIAPRKITYLKRHWLVALSLAIPAVRFLRIARAVRLARLARSAREIRLARTLGSLNRAFTALRSSFRRRGVGYITATTLAVVFGGSAAMYSFENGVADPQGIHTYATALWWTSMLMTTMGSAYWPETPEGRVLCVLLALYAFAVFGYVTATLASYFIDRDASRSDAAVAGTRDLDSLRQEIASLRQLIVDGRHPHHTQTE